jgi:hypothetical protein
MSQFLLDPENSELAALVSMAIRTITSLNGLNCNNHFVSRTAASQGVYPTTSRGMALAMSRNVTPRAWIFCGRRELVTRRGRLNFDGNLHVHLANPLVMEHCNVQY